MNMLVGDRVLDARVAAPVLQEVPISAPPAHPMPPPKDSFPRDPPQAQAQQAQAQAQRGLSPSPLDILDALDAGEIDAAAAVKLARRAAVDPHLTEGESAAYTRLLG